MRILIVSDSPWTPTGYGVQVALLAPRLRDLDAVAGGRPRAIRDEEDTHTLPQCGPDCLPGTRQGRALSSVE